MSRKIDLGECGPIAEMTPGDILEVYRQFRTKLEADPSIAAVLKLLRVPKLSASPLARLPSELMERLIAFLLPSLALPMTMLGASRIGTILFRSTRFAGFSWDAQHHEVGALVEAEQARMRLLGPAAAECHAREFNESPISQNYDRRVPKNPRLGCSRWFRDMVERIQYGHWRFKLLKASQDRVGTWLLLPHAAGHSLESLCDDYDEWINSEAVLNSDWYREYENEWDESLDIDTEDEDYE